MWSSTSRRRPPLRERRPPSGSVGNLPVPHIPPRSRGDWSHRVSATAATIDGHGNAPVSAYHDSLLRSPIFLGMIMFLGSEIMLFGSFFTVFFYLRFTHSPWPPAGIEVPKGPTGINTAILVSSSFTMHWALVSIKRNRRFGLICGLGLTLVMGLTFLAL